MYKSVTPHTRKERKVMRCINLSIISNWFVASKVKKINNTQKKRVLEKCKLGLT